MEYEFGTFARVMNRVSTYWSVFFFRVWPGLVRAGWIRAMPAAQTFVFLGAPAKAR